MTKPIEKIKEFNAGKLETKTASNPPPNDTEKTKKEIIAEKAIKKNDEDVAREEAAKLQAEEKARLDAIEQMQTSIASLIDRVNAKVDPAKTWLSALPTPGGIAALVIAIIIFALAVIPVDSAGHTRLYLFYQSLLGRTHMSYQETSNVGNVQTGGSAGADFGPGTGSGNGLSNIDFKHLNLFSLGE